MLYIFEMANNHQGSVEHAKKIIDEFSRLAKESNITAAIKLQFRQLDTFIHKDYINSDLKYVKRFRETRLTKQQFSEIVSYIREKSLIPMSTPFDNESLFLFEELKLPIVKVASCSIDDWPLLLEVSKINKKIIISTAGAEIETLKKVYNLFKSKNRDFAFMHCVGEYPTPVNASDLNRINVLRETFPDIEIGYSTHESPENTSMSPTAIAMGCTILEKHVGVETDTIKLNKYSNTCDQMRSVIKEIKEVQSAINGKSKIQTQSLKNLKRGVYIKSNIRKDHVLTENDVYYAMPVQEGQLDASNYYEFIGKKINKDLEKHDRLDTSCIISDTNNRIVDRIALYVKKTLEDSKISLSGKEKIDISCHYGIENFDRVGAVIIDKINRSFCKKLIVMLPNQRHPYHYHIKKEEAFELLSGDCTLFLNEKEINLQKGKPVLIPRKVYHSFHSKEGCVLEEVSTTHYPGDSIYQDPCINSLELGQRKIVLKLGSE